MSEHYFYAAPEDFGDHIILRGQECSHLAGVLRLKKGDSVHVLDGQGRVADAVIEKADRHAADLAVTEVHQFERPRSLPVIALAFSKAVRRGFFLEKAVELGAYEVWLWQGDYSQGKLPDSVRENWQGKMVAGIKQCRSPWLTKVRAFPEGITAVIEAAKDFEHHILPWEKQDGVDMLTEKDLGQDGRTIYCIGPEGGFSEREIDALQKAGYSAVSFGQRILRCETAATLCLGLHWWASQQNGHPDAVPGSKS